MSSCDASAEEAAGGPPAGAAGRDDEAPLQDARETAGYVAPEALGEEGGPEDVQGTSEPGEEGQRGPTSSRRRDGQRRRGWSPAELHAVALLHSLYGNRWCVLWVLEHGAAGFPMAFLIFVHGFHGNDAAVTLCCSAPAMCPCPRTIIARYYRSRSDGDVKVRDRLRWTAQSSACAACQLRSASSPQESWTLPTGGPRARASTPSFRRTSSIRPCARAPTAAAMC
jgi:hypothetical protein